MQLFSFRLVTQAEILSFAVQNNWGPRKRSAVQQLFTKIILIDIAQRIVIYYGHMQRLMPLGSLAKAVGKNDLWIAATAKIANAILVTTDDDFDHLHGTFISIKKYK